MLSFSIKLECSLEELQVGLGDEKWDDCLVFDGLFLESNDKLWKSVIEKKVICNHPPVIEQEYE
jgi:hypothetical protein